MSGLTREEKADLAQFLDSLPGMPRRVLFTGSRAWTDEDIVREVLGAVDEVVVHASWHMILVHGDARGLDTMAKRLTLASTWPFWIDEPHPARWEQFGRGAGPIRNQLMVNLGADACFGFKLEGSRGTEDCLKRARLANIPTWEVNR